MNDGEDDKNTGAPINAKDAGYAMGGIVLLCLSFILWLFYQMAVNMAPAERRPELVEVPQPVVRLPLSIHLARNVEVAYRGTSLSTWITLDQVRQRVYPEINRIWRPAGIEWVLQDIRDIEGDMPEARQLGAALAINHLGQTSDLPSIMRSYLQAIGARANDYHIVVVPLAGQGFVGQAFPRENAGTTAAWWLVVPRRGGTFWPNKMRLAEPQRFRQGSVARTAAHELGHLLGLDHMGCDRYCLMGMSQGHGLSDEEIATARSTARRNFWRLKE